MKIKPEHLKMLQKLVAPLDTPDRRKLYVSSGLTSRRYRWDLTYVAPGASDFMCVKLYEYLHDDHIDTALRSIVAPLEHETAE